jgi:hypothetical protein
VGQVICPHKCRLRSVEGPNETRSDRKIASSKLSRGVLQRAGKTCPAVFVQFWSGLLSQPVGGILATAVVAQGSRRQIGQTERVIELAHHQKAAIRTELSAPELHPHAAVEIDPISPLRTHTL